MGKYQVRAKMRELKPTGLNLFDRKKIAKKWIREGGYMRQVLYDLGFQVVRFHGCDCCDRRAYETWERGNNRIHTSFGYIDIPKKPIG